MDSVIAFLVGGVVVSIGWFFVARNNKKHVTEILNLDPKAKWDEIRKKIRDKL